MDFLNLMLAFGCLFASCDVPTDAADHSATTRSLRMNDAAPTTATLAWLKKGKKVSDHELTNFLTNLYNSDLSAPSRLGYNITASIHNRSAVQSSNGRSSKTKHAIREAVQNSSKIFDDEDYAALDQLLRLPTYSSFYNLLDNYEPQLGRAEVETSTKRVEVDAFLRAIAQTHVANLTLQFLRDVGKLDTMQQLTELVNKTWFGGLRRGGQRVLIDSSAFEHVFMGEHNADKLTSGFHNWIRLLVEERAGNVQYCGWLEANPYAFSMALIWRGYPKAKTSVFLGTSPELEIFAYTTCYLLRPDNSCPFNPDANHRLLVKNDYMDQNDKKLSSAYPIIPTKKGNQRKV